MYNNKSSFTNITIPEFIHSGRVFLFLLILWSSFRANANSFSATAKTDTNQIRIGEQFRLQFSATAPAGATVAFPFLTDTFNHFEIVNKGEIDTVNSDDKKSFTLKQQLILTSFDSGFFVLPPMPFVFSEKGKKDTSFTEAMLISVMTVAVDTTKEIKNIKGIIEVPFPWQDYLVYILIAAILVALGIYLWKRYKNKEQILPILVKPKRPPHEIALEKLKLLEEEKLWQQGLTKKYYSELTDILRQYIELRFDIYAMEQTTDEILTQFEKIKPKESEHQNLTFILRLADMVKFAKALPLPQENEKTIQSAYAFINETRPVIKEDFEKTEVIS